MALDPNIALGVKSLELPNQLAQYGQLAQIQNAQNQNQLAQYQLGSAQRAEKSQNMLADAYAQSTDPSTGKIDYNKLTGLLAAGGGGAQLPAIQKSRMEGESANTKLLADKLALLPQAYKMADTPESYLTLHKSIHADSVLGPWLNSVGATPEKGLASLQNAIQTGKFEDLRMRSMQSVSQLLDSIKPQVVAPGSSLVQGGKSVYTAPAAPTNLAKLQSELALLPANDPRRGQYEALIRKETTHAPGTTVNVSTEKKYGERFGGLIAEADAGKLTAAEKAPQLADSANRIIDLVKQGNVFVGPAADIKLNIARALNVTGANNQEKIANTESLIAASGQSTLDAIKTAGLGTGQGFTDKDLKFLQNIAGGTVNLTPQTLTDLAKLQHLAASRSAEAWNKRVQSLPKDVLQGTGLSTAPIKVAPLAAGQIAARPAGVGVNWTLERDAAGNTAWVSPDRKSFKEAQ